MRLFRAKMTYVCVFCIYAINALFLLLHAAKKSIPTHRTPFVSIVLPQVIGMLLLAVLAFVAVRKTSSSVEKWVSVLTGIICLLFVAGVLSEFGYRLPSPLRLHTAFVALSCAAAVLAGWRMFQVSGWPGAPGSRRAFRR